jgi:hypothetical protein
MSNDNATEARSLPALFMAMDESESRATGILSLTALLCPVTVTQALGDSTYSFMDRLQELPERHISMGPPELHGSAMLQGIHWATDEKRLRCFQYVVDLVNAHRIPVLRCAYYRRTVKPLLEMDPKLHALCFSGLTSMIQPYLANNFVIPIMDRTEGKHADRMAQTVHGTQILRASPWIDSATITLTNPENLGDVYFASSKYAVLIQLADVVGYLLHVRDYLRENLPLSDFKRQLLSLANDIDVALVRDEVIAMNWG